MGEGLTNGLYKFTATIHDDPPETVQLVVGDLSVAVTNAGEYVFLLEEKGMDYEYGIIPFMTNVSYSAVDDVPQTRGTVRGGRRSLPGDTLAQLNGTNAPLFRGLFAWICMATVSLPVRRRRKTAHRFKTTTMRRPMGEAMDKKTNKPKTARKPAKGKKNELLPVKAWEKLKGRGPFPSVAPEAYAVKGMKEK